MQKKRFPLLAKFITLFLVFAVALCVVICTITYFSYRGSMLQHYGHTAVGIGRVAASMLDVNEVLHYAETLEVDERYNEIYEELLRIRNESEMAYLYVQIPVSDNEVMYVFDAYDFEAEGEPHPLGRFDVYNENFNTAKEAMRTGEATAGLEVTRTQHGYLASAYVPMKNDEGVPVAYVGVDIEMGSIIQFLQQYIISIIGVTILVVVASFTVLLLVIRRSVLQPIGNIARKTGEFTENIEDEGFEPLYITSNDEIGSLATSVNQMFDDIRSYTVQLAQETAQRERVQSDLNTAQTIQESVLPRSFPPFLNCPDVEIFASMKPAKGVGGDFYDFFLIDDHRIGIVIADVSDKGVPAALFMMVARTLIKNQALSGKGPREVFESVNFQLCQSNEANMFVTAFLGIYDTRDNILRYVNAGHNPPILKRKDGETRWLPVETGFVLAGLEHVEYTTQIEIINPGDCLLLYTDGVTEATNRMGELFGDDTLFRLMEKINLDAFMSQQIVESVASAVDHFAGDAEQADDITMLLMRRL